MTLTEIEWGPSGEDVYRRTYSRIKPNGDYETWPETVARVARGNLSLVYGDDSQWTESVWAEYSNLTEHMLDFRILPAGRHLWASGVKGRQYLMNCWTSGWGEKLSDHFEFSFLRLMEGGGVGANYASRFLEPYGIPLRSLEVHVVCDREHPDWHKMEADGLLSMEYDADWDGAFIVEDSREGWAAALVDLIDTYMTDDLVKHNKRVYDVSNVRASGARLKTFGGTASGPAPFARMLSEIMVVMNRASHYWRTKPNDPESLTPLDAMEIDHAIAECVVSGGNRRSARMSILPWDDPHIHDFITCKQDTGKHWTTNISVEVNERFFTARNRGCPGCSSPAECLKRAQMADEVHSAVVKGMLTNGEPGYWNSSLSNEGELEPVYCTNPCGEITLQPWEPCNLGHVNLSKFVDSGTPDMGALVKAHDLITRFLVRATYGDVNDPKSREVLDSNRRIGVGHFGVQGFLAKRGLKISDVVSPSTDKFGSTVGQELRHLYDAVRYAADRYAFELRIPAPVKVTTVAPTGSIAKLPGTSEGIHPIYARYFIQRIRFAGNDRRQAERLEEYRQRGLKVEPCIYDPSGNTQVVEFPTKNALLDDVADPNLLEQADELSLDTMLAWQAFYQTHWADNAVSFTVNLPEGFPQREAERVIGRWLPYVKGTTIMVDGSRPQAPFERIDAWDYLEATRFGQDGNVGDSIDMECSTGACPIR